MGQVIANAEFNCVAPGEGSDHVAPSNVAQVLWLVAMQNPALGQATWSNDAFLPNVLADPHDDPSKTT